MSVKDSNLNKNTGAEVQRCTAIAVLILSDHVLIHSRLIRQTSARFKWSRVKTRIPKSTAMSSGFLVACLMSQTLQEMHFIGVWISKSFS